MRRRTNPVPVVIAVVIAVLGVQVGGAVLLAMSANDDSTSASLDIAMIVADSYAESGAMLARPARTTATDVSMRVADGAVAIDDREALATLMQGFMLAHRPFASITVASDGQVVRLTRAGTGPETRFILASGSEGDLRRQVLDSDGKVVADAPLPPPGRADLSWLDEVVPGEGSPVWAPVGGTGGTAPEIVVGVSSTGAVGTATVGVGITPEALGSSLAGGGDDAVGTAFLLTADGAVVAGPDGVAPDLATALAPVDGGVAGIAGDTVILERPIGETDAAEAPDWTVHVEVSPSRIAPAVADYPRRILVYGAVVAAVVVVAAAVMWRMRRPLSDLAMRARTDPLTGLANRHELDVCGRDMLDAAVRRHATVAVIVIDLDNFKTVNDDVGHDAGDAVLCACAHSLELHCGPRDLVARLGGDEFAVMRWIDPGVDVAGAVERLRHDTERDIREVAPEASLVGVSAGYASTDTAGTYSLEELLSAADAAMVGGRRDLKGATYAAQEPAEPEPATP